MKVRSFTTVDYVELKRESSIREAIAAFLEHRVDIGCITKNQKLVGIVHKHSIFRALLRDTSLDASIEHLINTHVVTIHKDQSLDEARETMIRGNVSQAVVLDNSQEIYGIMSKSDLLTSHMAVLKDTLSQMKSLIENLQDAVISVDAHLKIVTYNQTALRLLRLEGKHLDSAPIDHFLPSFRRWLIQTLKTGEIQDAKRIFFNDFTVIASFIPIREINNITGAMVVLRDVTSFENIANELETTKVLKKVLDSALELAYDGVAVTDNSGCITMANQGFLELFQLQQQSEAIGKGISAIAPQIPAEKSLLHDERIDGNLVEIGGQKCILTQMPIHQNGQKLGAIFKIIFRQLDVWKDLFLHMEKLENELSYYRGEYYRMSSDQPFAEVISVGPVMEKFKQEAAIAAVSMSNILITGESGTGKELIAEGIHRLSGRKGQFIKVNCGAIPHELLESEFFGYADGAFTGAKKGGKPGKFELAHGGTLFLDEIGDMPLALQVKLLRVLQEQEFERIGATRTTKVDVRILTATNKNLLELVREGKFREDLYYRIHVIPLHLPALRARLEDIPMLCAHFITKINERMNKGILGVSQEAISILQNYKWPGNIRELENVLERAFHYCSSTIIQEEHLPLELTQVSVEKEIVHAKHHRLNRRKSINETEKELILEALLQSKGNRTRAAQALDMSRTSLYQKIKKYGIMEELQVKFTTTQS